MIKELIKSRPFILLIIEGGPPDERIKSHFRDISARQLKRTESDDGDKGHLLYLCQNNEIVFHRLAKVDYDDLRAQLVHQSLHLKAPRFVEKRVDILISLDDFDIKLALKKREQLYHHSGRTFKNKDPYYVSVHSRSPCCARIPKGTRK